MTQDQFFDFNSLEAELLRAGEVAPDFTVSDLQDRAVTLSEVCRRNKAVIVYFWYIHCSGCRTALPQIRRLHEEFKSAGLEVLAVNRGDAEGATRDYAAQHGLAFPVLRVEKDALFRSYGVRGFPTLYLLDADSRVVLRRAGYRDATLREALAALLSGN